MLNDSQRQRQQGFLNLAEQHLSSAKILFNASGSNAPIILVSWQAAEDSLKALGIGHNEIQTHNLGQIMNHLRDNNILSENDLSQLSSHAAAITGSRTYNDTRYPENAPDYWPSQTRGAIGAAVAGASYFFDFAARKIALVNTSGSRQAP
jgi:HEPN domain-containing protein